MLNEEEILILILTAVLVILVISAIAYGVITDCPNTQNYVRCGR